jgi:hypothetical protein
MIGPAGTYATGNGICKILEEEGREKVVYSARQPENGIVLHLELGHQMRLKAGRLWLGLNRIPVVFHTREISDESERISDDIHAVNVLELDVRCFMTVASAPICLHSVPGVLEAFH